MAMLLFRWGFGGSRIVYVFSLRLWKSVGTGFAWFATCANRSYVVGKRYEAGFGTWNQGKQCKRLAAGDLFNAILQALH